MGIEADFSISAFNRLMDAVPEIISEEIIRALCYLGEECVKRIRDRSAAESWIDQTGNLRSSIGYAVYQEGETKMESSFPAVGNGREGAAKGHKAVMELASEYAGSRFALVILAGMEYAAYVEAKQSKDVVASTELWARSKAKGYIDNAIQRAEKKIAELQKQLGL